MVGKLIASIIVLTLILGTFGYAFALEEKAISTRMAWNGKECVTSDDYAKAVGTQNLDIIVCDYADQFSIDNKTTIYICEGVLRPLIDGTVVKEYRVVLEDGFDIGSLYVLSQSGVVKTVEFRGMNEWKAKRNTDNYVSPRDDADISGAILKYMPEKATVSNFSSYKNNKISQQGQYSQGAMQPWCAVACVSTLVEFYEDNGTDSPLKMAKSILPVVYDKKNEAGYLDKYSDNYIKALASDIDMEYRFYNGINAYQIKDLLSMLGYQSACYGTNNFGKTTGVASSIKSGALELFALENVEAGKAGHAILLNACYDNILVGYDPAYSKKNEQFISIYQADSFRGLGNVKVYMYDKNPKMYTISNRILGKKIINNRSYTDYSKDITEYLGLLKYRLEETEIDNTEVPELNDRVSWYSAETDRNIIADMFDISDTQTSFVATASTYEEASDPLLILKETIRNNPEVALFTYVASLTEYTTNESIIDESPLTVGNAVRRARLSLSDTIPIIGNNNVGYTSGQTSPVAFIGTLLNVRLHESQANGAVYKFSTMRSFMDEDKVIIMMLRNSTTGERYSLICLDGQPLANGNVQYQVLDPFVMASGSLKVKTIECSSTGANFVYTNPDILSGPVNWVGSVVSNATIAENVYGLEYNSYGELVVAE